MNCTMDNYSTGNLSNRTLFSDDPVHTSNMTSYGCTYHFLTLDGRRLSTRSNFTEKSSNSNPRKASARSQQKKVSPRAAVNRSQPSPQLSKRRLSTLSPQNIPAGSYGTISPYRYGVRKSCGGFRTPTSKTSTHLQQRRRGHQSVLHTPVTCENLIHTGRGLLLQERKKSESNPLALRMADLSISEKGPAAAKKHVNPPWRPAHRTSKLFQPRSIPRFKEPFTKL